MINCNPETVSTDYDTSDRLYFEPLTYEDVMAVYEHEASGGAPTLASSCNSVGRRRSTSRCRSKPRACPSSALRRRASIWPKIAVASASCWKSFPFRSRAARPRPAWKKRSPMPTASRYPVLVRPSYVLGGRAMVLAYDDDSLIQYMKEAVEYSQERPVLIDHFLESATEIDVDAISDGEDVVIGGIMQHIEEAGIHSGDSSCVLPAVDIPKHLLNTIRAIHLPACARAQSHRPDERAVRHPAQSRVTSSRSIRAPRAPCLTSRRPRACRWPRSPRA